MAEHGRLLDVRPTRAGGRSRRRYRLPVRAGTTGQHDRRPHRAGQSGGRAGARRPGPGGHPGARRPGTGRTDRRPDGRALPGHVRPGARPQRHDALEIAGAGSARPTPRAAGELENRRAAVEHLVQPLRDTLAKVEAQLRETEEARHLSHAALTEQMKITRQSSDDLRAQTQALVTALRRPEARGRWGEMQLRRVVEMAGMIPRCDFDEQVSVQSAEGAFRPDLVVRLAGGKNIVVDSKVSLAAYLEAAEASDEASGRRAWMPMPGTCVSTWTGSRRSRTGPRSARRPSSWCCSFPVRRSWPRRWSTTRRCWNTPWHARSTSPHPPHWSRCCGPPSTRGSRTRWPRTPGPPLTWAASSTSGSPAWAAHGPPGPRPHLRRHHLQPGRWVAGGRVLVSARKLNQLGVVEGDLETPTLIEEATGRCPPPNWPPPNWPPPNWPPPNWPPRTGRPERAAPERAAPELAAAELAAPELAAPEPEAPELAVPQQPHPPGSRQAAPAHPDRPTRTPAARSWLARTPNRGT